MTDVFCGTPDHSSKCKFTVWLGWIGTLLMRVFGDVFCQNLSFRFCADDKGEKSSAGLLLADVAHKRIGGKGGVTGGPYLLHGGQGGGFGNRLRDDTSPFVARRGRDGRASAISRLTGTPLGCRFYRV